MKISGRLQESAQVWVKRYTKLYFSTTRSVCFNKTPISRETENAYDLVQLFDSERYFKDFNTKAGESKSLFPKNRAGLFRNENLSTPRGLVDFSKKSLASAKSLVTKMLDDTKTSKEGKLTYIKKLDQLSDILCRVIDVAEFIRVTHPSSKWINAAQQTHEIMFEYMNQLNTNVDLYIELKKILEDTEIRSKLTSEEIQVGEYLQQDFERSGIHMDPHTRNNFVAITQEISLLGSKFNNDIHDLENYWIEVTKDEFEQLDDRRLKNEILTYQSKFTNLMKDTIQIPLTGSTPYSILTNCSSEVIRKKVWIALHNSSKEQIQNLDAFLKYRALLAKMLGYKSFAHYQLEHKMSKCPENVMAFLENLQGSLKKGGLLEEIKTLYNFKHNRDEKISADEIFEEVKPWDRDYLLTKLKLKENKAEPIDRIHEYFSVGTVMAGLSKLFTSLYNVKLIPEYTLDGETWNRNQVRKINVFDLGAKKTLGYLYLDFWSAKVLPSHFTIVCSRKLNDGINTETKNEMSKLVHLDEEKQYQLPVISLICNFSKDSDATFGRFAGVDNEKPTFLSLDQVDTIFHEMGHAMHSMIGKTELHNLSGTRCSTDFVELPSVLMESFSKDPRVLCEIGRHYSTGKTLSKEALEKYQASRISSDACENYMQSKMAMLDQVLHSEDVVLALEKGVQAFNSTEIYHNLEKQLQVFSDKWSTWHGKFPHLFSYGAVYYSYLLDRAIAEKVWQGLFAKDPWSREAGEKYKNSVLKWGGTRDPWICLADALSNDELSKGNSRAMEIIGKRQ